MTPADWIESASALAARHRDLTDLSAATCRKALLDVDRLFRQAPTPMREAYSQVPERALVAAGRLRADAVTSGDYAWTLPVDADLRSWALAAGAQARALDEVLFRTAPSHFGPVDPEEWLCAASGAYAIPRSRVRESERRREGHRFTRRGILHHRVLPEILEAGYRVKLVRHDTTASPAGEQVTMGAALFPGLKLAIRSADGGFVVTDAICDGAADTVARQIEAAYAGGCFAAMWPELTVTPALLALIRDTLGLRILTADPRSALQMVVAGSWHTEEDGKVWNVATVLDGYGAEALTYRKVLPYRDGKIGTEAIGMPAEVPVLVTDDHLFGFGICKDFCDLGVTLAYKDLDVDLVLVPSMGNPATMEGHRSTAKGMRVTFGTRAFVVQQADPDGPTAEQPGWVLPFPEDPTGKPVAELRQGGDWQVYTGTIPRGGD
ncbi:carbon-nitrogen hydrolase family protein [Methylobacterium flocculans]|uniref:hypothetical protein n=1 Tax=Methylobacterium flocculans TaxID=2984843 RepID=UPI0021F26669|nr:hypothetical protein [Methylobacterium sp. FF17]